jgi:site-specific recombinase XerD
LEPSPKFNSARDVAEPWGEYGLRQAFDRVAARAGLDTRWRFHDLRHYFVTNLFRTGAPAPTVQMLAGHAELSTTQRYAHTTRADLRAAMARVGVTVGQQPRENPDATSDAAE